MKKGLRTRIKLGFTAVGILLLFVGLASYFEIRQLQRSIDGFANDESQKIVLTEALVDGVFRQDAAAEDFLATGDVSRFGTRTESNLTELFRTLSQLKQYGSGKEELLRLENAVRYYSRITDTLYVKTVFGLSGREGWYESHYSQADRELKAEVKDFIASSQAGLTAEAQGQISTVYRSDVKILIVLIACMVILLMFYVLMNVFYLRPIIRMSRGLGDHLSEGKEYDVPVEGLDEVRELAGQVERLVNELDNRKQPEE